VIGNNPVTVIGHVIDVGTLDTHVVEVAWGDGAVDHPIVDPITRNFTASHMYGVGVTTRFAIIVKVLDDDTGLGTATSSTLVITPQITLPTATTQDQSPLFSLPSIDLAVGGGQPSYLANGGPLALGSGRPGGGDLNVTGSTDRAVKEGIPAELP